MRLFNNWPQKLFALLAMAIAFISLSFTPLRAQVEQGTTTTASTTSCSDEISCLQLIAASTSSILTKVNDIPTYLTTAGAFFLNMTSADATTPTAELQTEFTNLSNQLINISNGLNSRENLIKITADSLALPIAEFTANASGRAPIADSFPNINDLAYATVLGEPPLKNVPDRPALPYNYLRNASGILFPHIQPVSGWGAGGDQDALKRYVAYYNTIMSIQTYNAYVLDNMVAENNNNQFNTTQNTLIRKATDPSWLATIGSQEIGKVLRQLLLFESQNYVLMSNLLQTQKKLLTAQAMTNTLLIITAQDREVQLANRAQGGPTRI